MYRALDLNLEAECTMRIIGGKYKRKLLKAPKGSATRPTLDRVRESIFNLLFSRVDLVGARILDLFAGTGSLGLEAMSRGATSATFIERQSKVLAFARTNATSLGIDRQVWFFSADAVKYIERYKGPPFDVIFADPPYELPEIPKLPDLVLPHVAEGGRFVLEHDSTHSFENHPAIDTIRPYGRTIVSVFDPELIKD